MYMDINYFIASLVSMYLQPYSKENHFTKGLRIFFNSQKGASFLKILKFL